MTKIWDIYWWYPTWYINKIFLQPYPICPEIALCGSLIALWCCFDAIVPSKIWPPWSDSGGSVSFYTYTKIGARHDIKMMLIFIYTYLVGSLGFDIQTKEFQTSQTSRVVSILESYITWRRKQIGSTMILLSCLARDTEISLLLLGCITYANNRNNRSLDLRTSFLFPFTDYRTR